MDWNKLFRSLCQNKVSGVRCQDYELDEVENYSNLHSIIFFTDT